MNDQSRVFGALIDLFQGIGNGGFFADVFFAWKVFAGFVSIISLGIIIASLVLAFRLREKFAVRPPRKERKQEHKNQDKDVPVKKERGIVRAEWDALMKKCARATEHQVVALILEADNVADEALKRLGIPGEDMGARMKALSGQLDALDEFWSAHKTRNMIAHTPGFHVTLQDLERVLHQYHKALKELGAI